MGQVRIPAAIMRGGTSKGVFFHRADLPEDPRIRDLVLLRALGSPDPFRRQVDGMGGATSSTSKAAIIWRSARRDCDVDCLFAQVAVDRPVVDYSGSCGNLAAAVGPFAIEEGLAPAARVETVVRIWQVNTGRRIIAHVPTRDGLPVTEGDYVIDGVPRPGAEIRLEFLDPGGSAGRGLLPTGRVVDRLDVPGVGSLEATLLDAAVPVVFVGAPALGLEGAEPAEVVDRRPNLLAHLEAIRAHGAVAMGLAATLEEATRSRPAAPKVAFVAAARTYRTSRDETVDADAVDLVARIVSMGRVHHAFAVTGAIATAVAAILPGTVVQRAAGLTGERERVVRIGHPSGVIRVGAEVAREGQTWAARKAIVGRTARRLMGGYVRIPETVLAGRFEMPDEQAAAIPVD